MNEFKKIGAYVIDADKVGHKSYLAGTDCYQQLVDAFGNKIVGSDGEIDRKKLGEIVFSSSAERSKLNEIVWPEIKRLMRKERDEIAGQTVSDVLNNGGDSKKLKKILVIEAAILIEASWVDLVDEVWVITAPEALRVDRLVERNGITKSDALKRIKAQMSDSERKEYATVVIPNDKTKIDLIKRVEEEITQVEQRFYENVSQL